MSERAEILAKVCQLLREQNAAQAAALARTEYPFVPVESPRRRYSETRSHRIFLRDGYVDRYSGQRLVCPGALRLLGCLLPSEFPAHPNWKMSASHPMYWELFPTLDHVVPIARGGTDTDSNCVTTSMLRNQAKSSWLLEELGWKLHPADTTGSWDGLVSWFRELYARTAAAQDIPYLRRWYAATKGVA